MRTHSLHSDLVPRTRSQPQVDRRSSILEAATSLLLEHGWAVTTKQIADTAGVAEGTIYRYFPTKPELLRQAVSQVLDPGHQLAGFATIEPTAALDDKLDRIVAILLAAGERMHAVVLALHSPGSQEALGGLTPRVLTPRSLTSRGLTPLGQTSPDQSGAANSPPTWPSDPWAAAQAILDAIADLLRPDLGAQAETAAAFIRALTLAVTIPPMTHPSLRHQPTLRRLIAGALSFLEAPVSTSDVGSLAGADLPAGTDQPPDSVMTIQDRA